MKYKINFFLGVIVFCFAVCGQGDSSSIASENQTEEESLYLPEYTKEDAESAINDRVGFFPETLDESLPEKDLCGYILARLNAGARSLGKSTLNDGLSVDINNDGITEEVWSYSNAFMDSATIFKPGGVECVKEHRFRMDFPYSDECKGFVIREFAYRWDSGSYGVLIYGGKNYLTFMGSMKNDGNPAIQIIEFNKDMDYKVVCDYENTSGKVLSESQDDALCHFVKNSEDIEYIKPEAPEKEQEDAARLFGHKRAGIAGGDWWSVFVYPDLDIENSGKKKRVLAVSYTWLRPQLYGSFLMTTENYKDFEDVKGYEPNAYTNANYNIFKYKDKIYVSVSYQPYQVKGQKNGIREISLIENGEKQKMCVFRPQAAYGLTDQVDEEWRADRKGED